MSDIVKWMRSINDGSALTDSLREVRELKTEVERLRGVLGEIVGTLKGAPDDEGVKDLYDFARSALEAKP